LVGPRPGEIIGAVADTWRAPLIWRGMQVTARVITAMVGRLRVTGDVPEDLRQGPLILAPNHIGTFDPIALTAACLVRRIHPRIMATGGLFRAPIVGAAFRASGHIRVDRRTATVADALQVAKRALDQRSVLLGYPEGKISLDPGGWPERGKTGLARLALAARVTVVPVAQWGAHEVLPWGFPRGTMRAITRAVTRHPVLRVHFGAPVDLSDLDSSRPGAAQKATDRIMDAITEDLQKLRVQEPRLPRWIDPGRPISTARTHRPTPTLR
jgi:1-acyl-sn-glycerol-3-phosphate acyltransferase